MKEIKIRSWDTKLEKMIYGIDKIKKFYEGISLIDELLNPEKANISEIKIMLSIGLKDENKKEIYEGDILEINGKGFKPFLVKDIRVDTLTIARMIKNREDNKDFKPIKIIGNKWENPKLLGKEK